MGTRKIKITQYIPDFVSGVEKMEIFQDTFNPETVPWRKNWPDSIEFKVVLQPHHDREVCFARDPKRDKKNVWWGYAFIEKENPYPDKDGWIPTMK